jgi:hypothetical protein
MLTVVDLLILGGCQVVADAVQVMVVPVDPLQVSPDCRAEVTADVGVDGRRPDPGPIFSGDQEPGTTLLT